QHALEKKLCRAKLQSELRVTDVRDVRVTECVIADLVTFGQLTLQQIGVKFAAQSDHKECRGRVRLLQLIQDQGRVFGIGPVVECKRDLARRSAVTRDHPRRRKLGYGLSGNQTASGVEGYVSSAVLWLCGHAQDLAAFLSAVFVVEPVAVDHSLELEGRRFIERKVRAKEA